MEIRDEGPADAPAISRLVSADFAEAPHSSGTEAAIVDELRNAAALTLSLVAVDRDRIVGHVAILPVSIGGAT